MIKFKMLARDLAIEIVDGTLGFTCEANTNPSHHMGLYDTAEEKISEALNEVSVPGGGANARVAELEAEVERLSREATSRQSSLDLAHSRLRTANARLRETEDLASLMRRAAMTEFDFNTKVVTGTDHAAHLLVMTNGMEPYLDCVGVGFRTQGSDAWLVTSLSPARARILAHHLRMAAGYHETGYTGMECIDEYRSRLGEIADNREGQD